MVQRKDVDVETICPAFKLFQNMHSSLFRVCITSAGLAKLPSCLTCLCTILTSLLVHLLFQYWFHTQKCPGRVVRALGCSAEGRMLNPRSGSMTGKLSLSVITQLTSEMVRSSERRGFGQGVTFQMLCPRHDGALNTHFPKGHWIVLS